MNGLEARDIQMRFAGLVALDGVTLEAPRGRVTGLIGPNGAGKTTMFNVCGGFLRPTQGRVFIDSDDVTTSSPTDRARRGVGRTFQRLELFRSLTVRENIALAAEGQLISDGPLAQLGITRNSRAARVANREITEKLIDDVGLTGLADRRAGELSTGHGRLVELARTLANRPTVVLLDEPSSGLDPVESARFGAILRRLMDENDLALLLVEHDMNLVLSLCQWIYVIDFGRPIFEGTPDDIRRSPEVQAAYLGKAVA
ncbi:MAG: branched-chain amino acid transport system ATP-binding protein [Actinomycetota bacterium]|jgi:ABC-type branched-subunit amino acid transport system ATPase component|nr:branched-chain amino acid transport system ATP-binding protein [Actinomycetota bacterium]